MDSAVTAVRHSGQPIIIAEALNLFYALAWNNLGNKAVLAARGCVESSFEVLVNLAHDDSEFGAKAYMKAGSALGKFPVQPSILPSPYVH